MEQFFNSFIILALQQQFQVTGHIVKIEFIGGHTEKYSEISDRSSGFTQAFCQYLCNLFSTLDLIRWQGCRRVSRQKAFNARQKISA